MVGATLAALLAVAHPAAGSATDLCAERMLTPPDPGATDVLDEQVLARLRDIGSADEFVNVPIFTISPDGTRLAVQVRQGLPDENRFCLALVVIDLAGRDRPRAIDTGGELIRWIDPDQFGRADVVSGAARVVTPRWINDTSIAFLKKVGATAQVWRARTDGGAGAALTPASQDVADFVITDQGRTLVYDVRSAAGAARDALSAEGLRGYRYDARFFPIAQSTPYPVGPLPLSTISLDLATGISRAATAVEAAALHPSTTASQGAAPAVGERSAGAHLIAAGRDGRATACTSVSCRNPREFGWLDATRTTVLFTRRDGWAAGGMALYAWAVGSPAPRRIAATQGLLLSCTPAGPVIVCAQEAATQPRRLVTIDAHSGVIRPLYDPNAELVNLAHGSVERLRYRLAGREGFADLVYPTHYAAGRRFPLVVVQYTSRGFLRGGTGDENPIQGFAARGYFVLSYQEPDWYGGLKATDDAGRSREAQRGFWLRRMNLRAIEAQVRALVRRGMIDPQRIGITGLSDGSSTVQYAGLHSSLFSAGVVSGCCWERFQDAVLGSAVANWFHDIGWPPLASAAPRFWREISWAEQPDRVRFPILMQQADREYLNGLTSFTALEQAGRPVALYVFPDEQHIKWQPAHKLAVYSRTLAWFDFWLKPPAERRPEDSSFSVDWRALDRREPPAAAVPLTPGSAPKPPR